VLAPRVDDAHQDHRLLGRLVSTVWRDAAIWHFEVPKWDGDLRSSNFYVPISAENGRRKVDLLNKHYLSQAHHDWWDDEMFLGLMRIRGMECRSRYAEGFYVTKSITQIARRPMKAPPEVCEAQRRGRGQVSDRVGDHVQRNPGCE
jgi:LmbE family N-acetylglucosaminyl deacetylase